MKTSIVLTKALAAAILLTCSAGTPTQASETTSQTQFTDFQLKNLVVFKRSDIVMASPALIARALKIAPLKEQFIPQCTTSPTVTRIVKLKINKDFDVKKTGRDVVSKKISGGDLKSVPEPTLSAESTTYDLKLDKSVWEAHGQLMGIRIVLKDRDMIFLDDEHSVTTVETIDSAFYCLDKIKNVEDKKDGDKEDDTTALGKEKFQQVTFYVDETKMRTQKFNIRLIIFQKTTPYVLPIIVDPVVENNGFN